MGPGNQRATDGPEDATFVCRCLHSSRLKYRDEVRWALEFATGRNSRKATRSRWIRGFRCPQHLRRDRDLCLAPPAAAELPMTGDTSKGPCPPRETLPAR